jgi:hypothetical protein
MEAAQRALNTKTRKHLVSCFWVWVTPGNFKSVFHFILKFLVLSAESFNAASRIDQLLFPGKKWVAFRANFDADILFGRANLQNIATGAFDACFRILRMNVRFH